MQNDLIQKYIVDSRRGGFTDTDIKSALIKVGWPSELVESVLATTSGGKDYDKEKIRIGINAWLKGIFIDQIPKIIILAGLGIVSSAIGLLQPWPMKFLTDSVFGDIAAPGFLASYDKTELLYLVVVATILIFIITEIVEILSTVLRNYFTFNVDKEVKAGFFSHVLRLPLTYRGKLQSGDYVFRQNGEASEVAGIIFSTPIDLITSVFTIISTLYIMMRLDFRIGLLGIALSPLFVISGKVFAKRIQEQSTRVEKVMSQVYQHSTESIENVGLIQSFNRVEHQSKKLTDLMYKGFREMLRMEVLSSLMMLSISGIGTFTTAALIVIGGNEIFNSRLTFGELLVFTTYLGSFFMPIDRLTQTFTSFKRSYAVIERVFEVLNDHAEVDLDESTGLHKQTFDSDISFINATVLHDDIEIVKNINLTIKKGEKIGLIGQSGAGKSTLLDAITRANPHTGFIGIDGTDVKDINIQSLRSLLSVVRQDPGLFSDTIYNNIAYGFNGDVTMDMVVNASIAADAHEFVMQLPDQYNTNVGEAGAFLSGGQLQRIAIARSFLRNAPILLLDEPTSALDIESEKRVMRAVFDLMVDKTVIVISHKLSLLTQVDQVFVIEAGTVRNVKDYGGIESYLEYLRIHELA